MMPSRTGDKYHDQVLVLADNRRGDETDVRTIADSHRQILRLGGVNK